MDLRAALGTKLRSFGSVGLSDCDGARMRVLAFTTPRHGCRMWVLQLWKIGEPPGEHPHRITRSAGVSDQVVGEIRGPPSVRQGGLDGRVQTTGLTAVQLPRFGSCVQDLSRDIARFGWGFN